MGAEPLALHWQNYNNSKMEEEVTAPSKKGALRSLVERVWKKNPGTINLYFRTKHSKIYQLVGTR
jgi:tagatose-1,6-bisphosphate aldolase non-catalytic subunit AgaZ/GatZ